MKNDTALGAFIATVSQVALTLFGVEYYALIWSFVGTLFAVTQTTMTRPRAVVYVVLSTLMGAALGSGMREALDSQRQIYLIGLCLIGGFGSQLIIAAALQVVITRIKTFGGTSELPPPPR